MSTIIFRKLGIVDYSSALEKMRQFVHHAYLAEKKPCEEIWFLEHPPVFTLGQAGKKEHVLNPGEISVVESDRGGQVTYHGPGQLIIYFMLNLRQRKLGIKDLVFNIEQSVIHLLQNWQIQAARREGAPGVYVDGSKIASLGLRIRQGWSYHGLSLNVDMNLEPFSQINPCGIKGLAMTQIKCFIPEIEMNNVIERFNTLLQDFIP